MWKFQKWDIWHTYQEPYKFWLDRTKSRKNCLPPVMTRWLSEERPNSLIARSQVQTSTVHHRLRAPLCLLIQQHCWTDGPKFKPATICLQEPGTSVIASFIQRSPWRRGHGNDKSGIALASWLWGSLPWYQGISPSQEQTRISLEGLQIWWDNWNMLFC